MACHFISNAYKFHNKENSLIRKFVIKKVGKFSYRLGDSECFLQNKPLNIGELVSVTHLALDNK